jgi:secreted trypsin-like serine protease
MDQLQTENNNFYNFIDDVTKQLSEQRARERDMVSTELDSLKSGDTAKDGLQSTINEANRTSLAVDSSLNLLGSNMVDQVRQYSVQKDNEKILSSFNPQILI